jgi:uncharacterized protein YdeI (YjbR/CyaY-like superfamily)
MAKSSAAPLPVLAFSSARKWEKWLERNQAKSGGIWLRFYKKGSGRATVTRAEALDAALCHGWIDSQALPCDAESYLQKYSPRRSRSLWSKINTQHVARLIKGRRMKAAGLKQIAAAQADGRWRAAYDSHRTAVPPPDFVRRLAQDKKAAAFFATLKKNNVYAIVFRLQTAKKPETRARRMELILGMLGRGEKFHP